MRCIVFGATGYLGTRLVPELLSAGHEVRVMARRPAKLDDVSWRDRVEVVKGDVTDENQVRRALDGQQVLYYLVHSLLQQDFVKLDARAASTVADAAAEAGLSRIVYVGGIIAENQKLSQHLASRAEVGRLLLASGVPTVELRAAAIIGAGSASFEILRYLTERLPLMITPRWLRTYIQPIAVRDVLYYLTNAATLPADVNRPFDIGGPDTFTYTEMIRRYAAVAGLPRRIAVPAPVLTPRLSSLWVNLVTPIPRALAVSLMESLENDVVCADHDIADYIPDPPGGLMPYEQAVELALARMRDGEVPWAQPDADTAPSRSLPTDPQWAGGCLHEDLRERRVDADPHTLWQIVESIGAEHGLSADPVPWALHGWFSKVAGAVWTKRVRRHAHSLHFGEALGRWRVEHIDRPQLVRLRANVPLPGRLWLELSVHAHGDGGSSYRQRALFQPHGLSGESLWLASAPFRDVIFGGMARDITTTAQRSDTAHAGSRRVPADGRPVHSDV